jgi:hypothetical protein
MVLLVLDSVGAMQERRDAPEAEHCARTLPNDAFA